MRLLIGEDFSPWTEKARWALDHHGLEYDFHQYQPLIEEPWLRIKTGNLRDKATVPALLDGPEIARDSLAVAHYADRHRHSRPLFPSGHAAAIESWNERSERALRAGRALFFERLLQDRAAQLDNAPAFVPPRLRPLMRPAVHAGVLYLRAKHGADADFTQRARDELEASLSALREALTKSKYVLGELSYADLTMAVVLQFVRPVADDYIALAPANRRCWTEPRLAAQFADLIEWRDELYARHRRFERR
jgi:glutathione S-transferase